VLAKTLKVYADVGKKDWPHAFPNFLDTIMSLFKGETMLLGLSMLQTASEEFTSGRSLPSRRREELVAMLKVVSTFFRRNDRVSCRAIRFRNLACSWVEPIAQVWIIAHHARLSRSDQCPGARKIRLSDSHG
jgi:hypothetical protein